MNSINRKLSDPHSTDSTEKNKVLVETTKTILRNAFASTERDIEPLLRFLDTHNFWSARCNNHHKFPGGTMRHGLECLIWALKGCCPQYRHSASYYDYYPKWKDAPIESIVLVALLHDACDMRISDSNRRYYSHHGLKSVYFLGDRTMGNFHLRENELMAILHHMHKNLSANRFLNRPQLVDELNHNPLYQMIRHCDCISAGHPMTYEQLMKETDVILPLIK